MNNGQVDLAPQPLDLYAKTAAAGLLVPLQDSYRTVAGRDRVHLFTVLADGHRDEVTESSADSALPAAVSALLAVRTILAGAQLLSRQARHIND